MVPCGPDADLVPGVTDDGIHPAGGRRRLREPATRSRLGPTDRRGGADALCPGTDVWFRPILRFRHRVVPNGFELQFRLAEPGEFDSILPNEVFAQDDRFLVDAGAMSTRLHDGVVEVVTSKVLLMKRPDLRRRALHPRLRNGLRGHGGRHAGRSPRGADDTGLRRGHDTIRHEISDQRRLTVQSSTRMGSGGAGRGRGNDRASRAKRSGPWDSSPRWTT